MDDLKQSSAQKAMELDIFLFSNGEKSSPPRKHHLGSEQLVSLEATLSYLARQQYSSTHTAIQLHTLDGQVVKTHEDISDGATYVAVPLETTFVQSGYNQYLAKASRSREKRLARILSTEMDTPGASKEVPTDEGSIKNPAENNLVINKLETSVKANNSQRPSLIQPCWKPTGARTAALKPVANQGIRFPGIGRKLGSSPAELSARKAVLNKREPFTTYTKNGVRFPRLSHEDRSLSEGQKSRAKPETTQAEKITTQNNKSANSNVKPTRNSVKLKPILKPLTRKLVINNEESINDNESASVINRQVFITNRVSRPTDTSDVSKREDAIKKISDTIPEENYDINIIKKEAPIPQCIEISKPYGVLNEIKDPTIYSTKEIETIIPNEKFTRFKAVVTEVSSKFVPDTYINNENIVEIVKGDRKQSQSLSTKSSNNISNIKFDQNSFNIKGDKINDSKPNISSQTGESETSNNAFHRKSVEDQAKELTLVHNTHIKPFNDYSRVDRKYSTDSYHKKSQNENVNTTNNTNPEKLDFKSKFQAVKKHFESLDTTHQIEESKRPSEENWSVKFSDKNICLSPTTISPKPSEKLLNYTVVDKLVSNDAATVTGVSDPNKDLKKYGSFSKGKMGEISKGNSVLEHKIPISTMSCRRPSSKIIAEDIVATLLTLFTSATDNVKSDVIKTSSEMNKLNADFGTTYKSYKSYHGFNNLNDTEDKNDIDRNNDYIKTTHNIHSDERPTRDSIPQLPKFLKLPTYTSHSSNKFIAFIHKGQQVNLQISIAVRSASDTKVKEASEENPNTDMKTNEKSYTTRTHVSIANTSSKVDSAVYPHICCKTSNKMIISKCPCCDWMPPGHSNIPEVLNSSNDDLQPYYVLFPVMSSMCLTEDHRKPVSDKEVKNTESLLKVTISAHELKDERISDKEPKPTSASTVNDKNRAQSEISVMESGLTQTSSALLPKEVTEGASTQTDWSNVLLQAKLHEEGHYTFHLPPLSILRKYNL